MLPHEWKHLAGALNQRSVPAACAHGVDLRAGRLLLRGGLGDARDDHRGWAPAPRPDLFRPPRGLLFSPIDEKPKRWLTRAGSPVSATSNVVPMSLFSSIAGTRTRPDLAWLRCDGLAGLTAEPAARAGHRRAPRETSAVRRPRPRSETADPDRDRTGSELGRPQRSRKIASPIGRRQWVELIAWW